MMTPMNPPISSQLAKALYPHVFNEIDQLVNILRLQPDNQTWHNARIECIAIHARCLNEFFGKGKRDDDVLASHFAFSENYLDEIVVKRTDKDICHLTYTRVENYPEKSHWGESELDPMLAVCERFVTHILNSPVLTGSLDEHAVVAWQHLREKLNQYNAERK